MITENEDQLHLLKKYPFLLPRDSSFTAYNGFLKINGKEFFLSLEVPDYPALSNLKLDSDSELNQLICNHSSHLLHLTSSCSTLLHFLDKLCEIIEKNMSTCILDSLQFTTGSICQQELRDLNRYSVVLLELKKLRTDCIKALSNDLMIISLCGNNIDSKECNLTLKLNPHYPDIPNNKSSFDVIDSDVPQPIIRLIEKEANIVNAYNMFCKQLLLLEPIWASLKVIDNLCWVVDPTHPKRADTYRRIFIEYPRVMAQVTWNPLQPNQRPIIKFQGAEIQVEQYRSTYERNFEEWRSDNNIVGNICAVLCIADLPSSPDNGPQHFETGECCICLSALLEGRLPEFSCGQCLSCFHIACLHEWLNILPSSRQALGHLIGACPNCEAGIKCPCPITGV